MVDSKFSLDTDLISKVFTLTWVIRSILFLMAAASLVWMVGDRVLTIALEDNRQRVSNVENGLQALRDTVGSTNDNLLNLQRDLRSEVSDNRLDIALLKVSSDSVRAEVAAIETAAAKVIAKATEEAVAEEAVAVAEVASSATEEVEPKEIKPIILRDRSTGDEPLPDLRKDMDSIHDGLLQYNEKLERARGLLDRLNGLVE